MRDISTAKYISFGTYRKDGTLVSTPTWVVPFRGGYAFTTEAGSWKTKRLVRDPRVVVAPSDFRGRTLDGATTRVGQGRLLEGASIREAQRAIRAKYRLAWLLSLSPRRLWQRLQGKPQVGDCAIYFELEA